MDVNKHNSRPRLKEAITCPSNVEVLNTVVFDSPRIAKNEETEDAEMRGLILFEAFNSSLRPQLQNSRPRGSGSLSRFITSVKEQSRPYRQPARSCVLHLLRNPTILQNAGMAESYHPPGNRTALGLERARVACQRCHEKKVRCDAFKQTPCSGCAANGAKCALITSQRGR